MNFFKLATAKRNGPTWTFSICVTEQIDFGKLLVEDVRHIHGFYIYKFKTEHLDNIISYLNSLNYVVQFH